MTNPKDQCRSCGLTRDAHWGYHCLAAGRCTGFVPLKPCAEFRQNPKYDEPFCVCSYPQNEHCLAAQGITEHFNYAV